MDYTTRDSSDGFITVHVGGGHRLDFRHTDNTRIADFMNFLGKARRGSPLDAVLHLLQLHGVLAVMNPAGEEATWYHVAVADVRHATAILSRHDITTTDARIRRLAALVDAYLTNPDGHPKSNRGIIEHAGDQLNKLLADQFDDRMGLAEFRAAIAAEHLPRLAAEHVLIATPYGLEPVVVFDCPWPNADGSVTYGRMFIACVKPDGITLHQARVDEDGLATPGIPGPDTSHVGHSTVSIQAALDQAAYNLAAAARNRA